PISTNEQTRTVVVLKNEPGSHWISSLPRPPQSALPASVFAESRRESTTTPAAPNGQRPGPVSAPKPPGPRSGEDRLSCVHSIEPRFDRIGSEGEKDGFYRSWNLPKFSNVDSRQVIMGTPTFTCGGWHSGILTQALERRWDAVAFAKWFVGNPDLAVRVMNDAPLRAHDRGRFCGSWDGVRETGCVGYPPSENGAIAEHGQVTEVRGRHRGTGLRNRGVLNPSRHDLATRVCSKPPC
ncbi:hypothetical protein LX36DRAFT_724049, partial [Colletotrichum falcatum]